ncbi:AraC family transcriptional regulator [Dactylosporangium aurantiacum]|uniref:AraC family transcriptional regulator n=1 Tax=Dactylosporangium aurantiacum TaxID=35754 RepID=A0A9Q9IM68_9ACTN|nr:AraC family transcriptional regulator [Dactylosporangium aurantiacum]MDG6107700.1 AraC family transcriptional regulator [Dactylosporangium aurantiacum]UWZ58709.1 AraC family transcriptional regulator [Dactylosporangium aurantiacum]
MDPLEDVLALLDATSEVSAGLVAGGDWAVRFPPPAGSKFNAVRRGSCWLRVDGVGDPVHLDEGDCFLLTRPLGFTLASDPGRPAEPAYPIFAAAGDGPAHAGEGDEVFLIGAAFTFTERAQALLLHSLPPVIHVPGGAAEAGTVRWALDELDAELRGRPLGATLVAERLAIVMLVRMLRLHLARDPGRRTGWLAGLTDPTVAAALRAMHARPAHAWTVAELARVVAVSRSALAARFKDVVGKGPLEYLTEWRIELAADRLRRSDDTVATIARAVGYGSESALSVAFKRTTGRSPRAYRSRLTTTG